MIQNKEDRVREADSQRDTLQVSVTYLLAFRLYKILTRNEKDFYASASSEDEMKHIVSASVNRKSHLVEAHALIGQPSCVD